MSGAPDTVVSKSIFAISTSSTPQQLFVGLSPNDGGTVDANGHNDSLDPNTILLKQ